MVTTGGGTSLLFPIGCEGTGKGTPPEAIEEEGTTIDKEEDNLDVGYGDLDGVIDPIPVVDVPVVTADPATELISLAIPEAVAVDPATDETELTACRASRFKGEAEARPRARRGKSLYIILFLFLVGLE